MSRIFRSSSSAHVDAPRSLQRSNSISAAHIGDDSKQINDSVATIAAAIRRPAPHGLALHAIKQKFGSKIDAAVLGSEVVDWMAEHCSVQHSRHDFRAACGVLMKHDLLVTATKKRLTTFKEKYAFAFGAPRGSLLFLSSLPSSSSSSSSSSSEAPSSSITAESLSFAISSLVLETTQRAGTATSALLSGSPLASSSLSLSDGSLSGSSGSIGGGTSSSASGSASREGSSLFASWATDASSSDSSKDDALFDVSTSGQRVLKAASGQRLVKEVLECASDEQAIFWQTYPLFMTFKELCRHLSDILTPEVPSCASPEEMIHYGMELSRRQTAAASFLKLGLHTVPTDVRSTPDNAARLQQLITDYIELGSAHVTLALRGALTAVLDANNDKQQRPLNAAEQLAALLDAGASHNDKQQEQCPSDSAELVGHSEPYNLLRWTQVLSSGELSAVQLGSALLHVDAAHFRALTFREFLDCAWTKPDSRAQAAPNICAYTASFNRISRWASSVVVACLALKQRVAIIELLLAASTFLAEQRDYTGVLAIVTGISSSAVVRLKSTWDAVSPEALAQLDKLKELTAFDGNYRNYRAALATAGAADCVPYVGLTLTDLVYLNDGNPPTLPSLVRQAPLVNWFKHRRSGEIIAAMLARPCSYAHIAASDELVRQLLVVESVGEEEAFAASLQIEPKNSIMHIENLLVQLDEQKARLREDQLKYEALHADHQQLRRRFDELSAENQQLLVLLAQADPEAFRAFVDANKS